MQFKVQIFWLYMSNSVTCVCSVSRAELCDVVSCGEIWGGHTSETPGPTEEEPAGQPGDPSCLTYNTDYRIISLDMLNSVYSKNSLKIIPVCLY